MANLNNFVQFYDCFLGTGWAALESYFMLLHNFFFLSFWWPFATYPCLNSGNSSHPHFYATFICPFPLLQLPILLNPHWNLRPSFSPSFLLPRWRDLIPTCNTPSNQRFPSRETGVPTASGSSSRLLSSIVVTIRGRMVSKEESDQIGTLLIFMHRITSQVSKTSPDCWPKQHQISFPDDSKRALPSHIGEQTTHMAHWGSVFWSYILLLNLYPVPVHYPRWQCEPLGPSCPCTAWSVPLKLDHRVHALSLHKQSLLILFTAPISAGKESQLYRGSRGSLPQFHESSMKIDNET